MLFSCRYAQLAWGVTGDILRALRWPDLSNSAVACLLGYVQVSPPVDLFPWIGLPPSDDTLKKWFLSFFDALRGITLNTIWSVRNRVRVSLTDSSPLGEIEHRLRGGIYDGLFNLSFVHFHIRERTTPTRLVFDAFIWNRLTVLLNHSFRRELP